MQYLIAVNNLDSDTIRNIVNMSLIDYLTKNESADLDVETIIYDKTTCCIVLSSIAKWDDIYAFANIIKEDIAMYEDHLANSYNP